MITKDQNYWEVGAVNLCISAMSRAQTSFWPSSALDLNIIKLHEDGWGIRSVKKQTTFNLNSEIIHYKQIFFCISCIFPPLKSTKCHVQLSPSLVGSRWVIDRYFLTIILLFRTIYAIKKRNEAINQVSQAIKIVSQ